MLELMEIQKTLKAPKGQKNNFGNYKYRSCEDILEALKGPLSDNNCLLTISDNIEMIGHRYYVKSTATLINAKGKEISVTASAREAENKKGMDESQITGASSSYARKYALNGLFAIDDTADADTMDNKNEGKKKPPVKKENWLVEGSEEWNKCVAWIESTPTITNHIAEIKKKYSLTSVNENKLVAILRELAQ